MAFYSLLIVDKQETVSGVVARDRAEAVAMLGRKIGRALTLDDDDDPCVARYLLDEWWDGPHWVNHTIPVFVKEP
jgi:hypothetical protein